MSEIDWPLVLETQSEWHLIVAILPQGSSVNRDTLTQRVNLLRRLSSAYRLRGYFSFATVGSSNGITVDCAFSVEADADRLSAVVGARSVHEFPGWASQRCFWFNQTVIAAIEHVLFERAVGESDTARK